MNLIWKTLMVSAASMHLAMAWSTWTGLGFVAASPGLTALRRIFPDDIWPVWFALTGLFAIGGLCWVSLARLHFISAALLMLIWSIATLALWPDRGPQPGGFLLLHLAVLKAACGIYADRLRRIRRAAHRLELVVDAAEGDVRHHVQA
jgi:hypothetical protein